MQSIFASGRTLWASVRAKWLLSEKCEAHDYWNWCLEVIWHGRQYEGHSGSVQRFSDGDRLKDMVYVTTAKVWTNKDVYSITSLVTLPLDSLSGVINVGCRNIFWDNASVWIPSIQWNQDWMTTPVTSDVWTCSFYCAIRMHLLLPSWLSQLMGSRCVFHIYVGPNVKWTFDSQNVWHTEMCTSVSETTLFNIRYFIWAVLKRLMWNLMCMWTHLVWNTGQ